MKPLSQFSRSALPAAIAGVLLASASSGAFAANAVSIQAWGNGLTAPSLAIGDSISVTKTLVKSGYADNPDLNFSAWAHAGGSPWYIFNLSQQANVTIGLAPTNAGVEFNPGLTLWAAGNAPFNAGTSNLNELANNGWNTPHSFNAVGQLGDNGTFWQMAPLGNQAETLAYAVTGPSHTNTAATGWGETILTGVHDVSVDNLYEHGITGTANAGANFLQLQVTDLQPGWYTLFIGGTNNALSSQSYQLSVSAVPLPGGLGLALSGIGMMGAALRRRRNASQG